MIKELIHTFKKPAPAQLAAQELLDAQRELLQAQSAAEYYAQIARYNETRIARLKNFMVPYETLESTTP